jgi:UDP:flavonoid glycosyltransferase YjiC (YdhE family)
MAHVLLIPIGSSGDVHPHVGIGRALRARGHQVTLVNNSQFEPLARRAGLDFLSVGSAEEYQKMMSHPDLWNTKGGKGGRIFLEQMIRPLVRRVYETVAAHYVAGETVLVGSGIAFGARIAHDKLGVPLVTMHIQPAAMPSVHRASIGPGFFLPRWMPGWCRRLCFWGVDVISDRFLAPEINALRAELGLPAVRWVYSVGNAWCHSPQRVLGLFPDWFCPLQPDWPPQTRLTGFPLFDESDLEDLPAGVAEFLAQGDPPIVFTAGTPMAHCRPFFEASVEACRLLGRRGVLLTRFADQVPAQLPEGVRHFDYIPFSQILPRAAALVHHGGIGTLAQALRAGVPQLAVPVTLDLPDNAALLEQLGVGLSLRPRAYHGEAAAEAIQRLLNTPGIAERSRSIADRFRGRDPVGETCQAIEEVARTLAR